MARKYGAQEDQTTQPENTGDTFGNLCTKKHKKVQKMKMTAAHTTEKQV